jgi:hypothetical protein
MIDYRFGRFGHACAVHGKGRDGGWVFDDFIKKRLSSSTVATERTTRD